MGLHNRDYYREKYKIKHEPLRSLTKKSGKNKTGIKYLLYPFVAIAALWYGADNLLDKANNPTLTIDGKVKPDRKEKPLDLISGGVILKTDRQGHFRGIALINNIPMPFMIDTGATKTSIPAKMAVAANLPLGRSIQSSTAGGQVVDHLTQINSLKIGNAEIKNLDANINQYLDEVLIGMNTLKYFHMTQSGNTLTLVANNQLGNNPTSAQAFSQSNNKMPIDTLATNKPIKKTITCDERKVCKIIYSNR